MDPSIVEARLSSTPHGIGIGGVSKRLKKSFPNVFLEGNRPAGGTEGKDEVVAIQSQTGECFCSAATGEIILTCQIQGKVFPIHFCLLPEPLVSGKAPLDGLEGIVNGFHHGLFLPKGIPI